MLFAEDVLSRNPGAEIIFDVNLRAICLTGSEAVEANPHYGKPATRSSKPK